MRPRQDEPASGAAERRQVRAVLRGDERAFREMYAAHNDVLYRAALRLLGGSRGAAEDALQECWRRALGGLRGYQHRGTLRSWLRGIVVRCALERIRWERRDGERLPAQLPERDGPCRSGSAARRIDLERALEDLPPGYRAVLVLHDVEGYRHDEIAEMLAIATGTSKSQLSRARAWMRRALGPDYRTE